MTRTSRAIVVWLVLVLALARDAALARLDSQETDVLGVAGLWRYESLRRKTGPAVRLDGYFLLRDGRFVQQSLDLGDPLEAQIAQAHAGTYRVENAELRLFVEVGLIVTPPNDAPLASSPNKEHRVAVSRAGDRLTLTFSTGTVQELRRVGPGQGQVIVLDRGALALVDGHFLLVVETGDRAVSGSGSFERAGRTLQLRPARWFDATAGKVRYARDAVVPATLTDREVMLADRPPFRVIR